MQFTLKYTVESRPKNNPNIVAHNDVSGQFASIAELLSLIDTGNNKKTNLISYKYYMTSEQVRDNKIIVSKK